jgi:hypothetical protein
LVNVTSGSYEPIGDELNGQVALLQAAAALDAAVFLAVESKNVDKLMDTVAMWIGIAERLGIESIEEEAESQKTFGFSGRSSVEEKEEEVTEEDA